MTGRFRGSWYWNNIVMKIKLQKLRWTQSVTRMLKENIHGKFSWETQWKEATSEIKGKWKGIELILGT